MKRIPPEIEVNYNNEGCWKWLFRLNDQDYGLVTIDGHRFRAHRVIYQLFKGPIPKGLQLDHLCRNHWCVNPDHLEIVTNAINQRRGILSKLSDEDIINIKKMRTEGIRVVEIAKKYMIHRNHVYNILNEKRRREI